jgi:hypothetical protein
MDRLLGRWQISSEKDQITMFLLQGAMYPVLREDRRNVPNNEKVSGKETLLQTHQTRVELWLYLQTQPRISAVPSDTCLVSR